MTEAPTKVKVNCYLNNGSLTNGRRAVLHSSWDWPTCLLKISAKLKLEHIDGESCLYTKQGVLVDEVDELIDLEDVFYAPKGHPYIKLQLDHPEEGVHAVVPQAMGNGSNSNTSSNDSLPPVPPPGAEVGQTPSTAVPNGGVGVGPPMFLGTSLPQPDDKDSVEIEATVLSNIDPSGGGQAVIGSRSAGRRTDVASAKAKSSHAGAPSLEDHIGASLANEINAMGLEEQGAIPQAGEDSRYRTWGGWDLFAAERSLGGDAESEKWSQHLRLGKNSTDGTSLGGGGRMMADGWKSNQKKIQSCGALPIAPPLVTSSSSPRSAQQQAERGEGGRHTLLVIPKPEDLHQMRQEQPHQKISPTSVPANGADTSNGGGSNGGGRSGGKAGGADKRDFGAYLQSCYVTDDQMHTLLLTNVQTHIPEGELFEIFDSFGEIRMVWTDQKHQGVVLVEYCDLRSSVQARSHLKFKMPRTKSDLNAAVSAQARVTVDFCCPVRTTAASAIAQPPHGWVTITTDQPVFADDIAQVVARRFGEVRFLRNDGNKDDLRDTKFKAQYWNSMGAQEAVKGLQGIQVHMGKTGGPVKILMSTKPLPVMLLDHSRSLSALLMNHGQDGINNKDGWAGDSHSHPSWDDMGAGGATSGGGSDGHAHQAFFNTSQDSQYGMEYDTNRQQQQDYDNGRPQNTTMHMYSNWQPQSRGQHHHQQQQPNGWQQQQPNSYKNDNNVPSGGYGGYPGVPVQNTHPYSSNGRNGGGGGFQGGGGHHPNMRGGSGGHVLNGRDGNNNIGNNNNNSRGGGRRHGDPQSNGDTDFKLDLDRVIQGRDNRTTLMIRNIPNKYSQRVLLEEINHNHKGRYDFFYLPIDFKNKCNVGYAFINFMDAMAIVNFSNEFNQQRWKNFNSEKVCALSYARIQGKAAMIARFQNSSLMDKDDEYQPLIFKSDGEDKGMPELFPIGKARHTGGPS